MGDEPMVRFEVMLEPRDPKEFATLEADVREAFDAEMLIGGLADAFSDMLETPVFVSITHPTSLQPEPR